MPKKTKRYRVRAEYGCRVVADVDARNEKEAEQNAMDELDELASRNLSQLDLKVEEI